MAKCKRCGKGGFFFKVNDKGLCVACVEQHKLEMEKKYRQQYQGISEAQLNNRTSTISYGTWSRPLFDDKEWVQKRLKIAEAIFTEISTSGYFKPEKLPELAEKIKIAVTSNIIYKDPFNYADCLTLEEKRSYKFNTRQKISREMVDFMTESGLKHDDPKKILENAYNRQISITSNEDRAKMYKNVQSQDSIFSSYQFLATLDTRTCIVCGSLDGQIFDTPDMTHKCLNEDCRCMMLPVIKGMENIFDDGDERASMDGPVPAKMTYAKWLKKQSAKIKREILGEYYDRYKAGESLFDIVSSLKI